MKKLLSLIATLVFLNGAQSAEEKKATSSASTSSKKAIKYEKNTKLEFDGRSIDGNVVSPDSADVEGDKNLKFEPLLEGRKDFKREFKRSSGVAK